MLLPSPSGARSRPSLGELWKECSLRRAVIIAPYSPYNQHSQHTATGVTSGSPDGSLLSPSGLLAEIAACCPIQGSVCRIVGRNLRCLGPPRLTSVQNRSDDVRNSLCRLFHG
ncbi:hypothetical protein PoB_003880000 [Plakobranchus ocellatus]|uniref:Uncharacterized protein n=1 Tax=Plakobranchus ocellatus TaxID=259542 RepID=A0AAV4AVC1_9GAST|nr:hypothetical protein PoB_003880000 [Plakobranchus ocellatus]